MNIPCRTLAGEIELARAGHTLSLRQRHLLQLVDGQHTLAEVRAIAAAAGLPPDGLGDLMVRGLVAMQAIETLAIYDAVPVGMAWAGSRAESQSGWARLPDVAPRAVTVRRPVRHALDRSLGRMTVAPPRGGVDPARKPALLPLEGRKRVGRDPGFDEARHLVVTVLRQVAPLRSTFTRWKVRRAPDRQALRALLPAVRRRLAGQAPGARLWPMMRRVEHLLASCIPCLAGRQV
jgi:hypothetical protein